MSDWEKHYVVVVCPKCRIQSQIVEDTGQKTIRCQNCGANLKFRKLRQFHNSTDLEEAILARTKLQASLVGKGTASIISTVEVDESKIKEKADDVTRPRKPLEIVLSNIPEKGNISHEELKSSAGKLGLGEEKFETTLRKLLESGHIYEPKNGFFRRA
ncbi:DNA replicative helicase MCM subunit Mcm2 (Cdc46/Mcm family) [Methanohalophilus levihalophilus]|uniref:DUF5817 domain-containing protein n=1 Tax=Methanohalophilus levihalophilus TaxID=1431282 RepID=UPI001AE8E026|nr:hypothetical protein [Methanohalophilus levihalophilus]MBP2030052.1 DNA replicative helicase MCM subunit Mcm2 (Cdc46/Mcm family) [Methanohalophilus levihalophilus]